MTSTEKEYAAALFELACESGKETEYGDALHTAQTVIFADARYPQLLSVPSIPSSERTKMLREAIGDAVPEVVRDFLSLLTERGRIAMLPRCVEEYDILPVSYTHLDVYKRQICESGTHDELMKKRGMYYEMFIKQSENYHIYPQET